jgi:class 3 adenylate cyclase
MADRGARLLVADDNKVNRLLLARRLELQGHEVTLAENGRVALEKLRTEPFDLLLLDIEMPEIDGLQVLEQLKSDLHLRDLPVIVTSVLEGLDKVVRCIELGAEDYLHKPVNPVLLRARIGASLEKKRLRDQQKEMVRRFATSEVAEDLERSGFALGGHRVRATAMFSDIRGFTAMAERMAPEEAIELLNTYYTLMFEAITSQGGVVNQMVGDGLMAIFGAPLPLTEPCRAAARAALDMQEMLELFNREPERAGKPPIRIGIGIATGDVIAGYTGTQRRATYTCVGDTVNVAARIEAHTKVAGRPILVDEPTWQALDGRFEGEAIGTVFLHGRDDPVSLHALVRACSPVADPA